VRTPTNLNCLPPLDLHKAHKIHPQGLRVDAPRVSIKSGSQYKDDPIRLYIAHPYLHLLLHSRKLFENTRNFWFGPNDPLYRPLDARSTQILLELHFRCDPKNDELLLEIFWTEVPFQKIRSSLGEGSQIPRHGKRRNSNIQRE
jgi:hypothetical protein